MSKVSWDSIFQNEFSKSYYKDLSSFLEDERSKYEVYPPKHLRFRAFELTPFDQVKVVVLGQDPYPGVNQAHGLSFSVERNCKIPKSLINIYKELSSDLSIKTPKHGNLESWAEQGVLLLNTVLSVRKSEAASHRNKGWENFTDQILEQLCTTHSNLVFILWGKDAQKKEKLIVGDHLVLKSAHPSPLAAYRGFFGSKPFSKVNDYLSRVNKKKINWALDDISK
ncbi:MAG: uracil-DNA glycosylase [Candidatus Cloacimonetes bacterium]|nr:uracil-DNA glycosylase [Candidatus Cloacimonadota bacterium]